MIRVMTSDEPALTTITVDGQLSGEYVEVVEGSCDAARSKDKPISLFLRDVTVIGEDGQALLRRLATKGVLLKSSGVYNSYIVESIQPDDLLGTTPGQSNADSAGQDRLQEGRRSAEQFSRAKPASTPVPTQARHMTTGLPPGPVAEERFHCAR